MDTLHVIIPCYDMAPWVGETVASVKAQKGGGWDCIIVDDGSRDGSGDILDALTEGDPRFRVIHTPNKGVAAARNRAIAEAGGGYILPLDADDRLLPYAVSRFRHEWMRNPGASLLVPRIRRFDAHGHTSIQHRTWYGYGDLKERCTPTNSSCYRYADWERVGGYRPWSMYEDWEFWLRLLWRNDRVVNIPEVLVEYRVRPGSRWHQAVECHDEEVEYIRTMNPHIFTK